MKKLIYLFTLLISISFTACQDAIIVDLDEGTPQLTVDAVITDNYGKQTIRLTTSNPYFENTSATGITNATVSLLNTSNGKIYNFLHEQNGNYSWSPAGGDTLAVMDHAYTLRIVYNNEEYQATSQLNPVPQIDSIGYEFRPASGPAPEGYFASFYALDIPNRADYYWIRTYRNDSLLNKPANINIAVDAAFPPNGGADGFLFIPPIREAITPFDKPYKLGDKIKVEICSITEDAYEFLSEAQKQMVNGGLFATPPSNVRTNIQNITNPDKKAVGWFVISAISSKETVIK